MKRGREAVIFFVAFFVTFVLISSIVIRNIGSPQTTGMAISSGDIAANYSFNQGNLAGNSGEEPMGENYGATFVTGKTGWALNLVGASSQYVDFGGDYGGFAIPSSTSGFSFSFWVKPVATTAAEFILSKAAGNNVEYLVKLTSSNFISLDINNNFITTTTAVPTDSWTNVIGVYDNGKMRLYVSGKRINEKSATAITGGTGSLKIGQWSGGGYYTGLFDDLVIYSKAITDDEAVEINGTVSCIPSCPADTCGSDGCGGTCQCRGSKNCVSGVCVTPSSGPDAQYLFENNLQGSVAGNLEGTPQGTVTFDSSDKREGSYSLKLDNSAVGAKNYVLIPDSDGLDAQALKSFKVSVWIKPDVQATKTAEYILSKSGSGNGNIEYLLRLDSTHKVIFTMSDSSASTATSVSATSPSAITDDWHKIMGEFNLSNRKINLYIDDMANPVVTSSNALTPIISGTNSLKVGNYGGANLFSGRIDELVIQSSTVTCVANWNCGNWGACVSGTQSRTCTDSNNCESPNTRTETQSCSNLLKAYYKLESATAGAVTDEVLGNNGIIHGSGATFSSGKDGNAMFLDGLTYAKVPDNNNIDVSSDGITISAWVKPNSCTNAGSQPIVSKGNEYILKMDGSCYVNFYLGGGASSNLLTAVDTATISSWTHIAGVYNETSQTMKIYVNGLNKGKVKTGISPLGTSAADMNIGLYSGKNFTGGIDEVKIFQRALSDDEIAVLAQISTCTDTCRSKGFECGNQMICGAQTNCGACSGTHTCGSDGKCVENQGCIPGSQQNTCPENLPKCDPDTSICVQCLNNGDCNTGENCVNKICVSNMQCTSDNDCTGANKKCDLTSGNCVECLPDTQATDCAAGQVCTDEFNCQTPGTENCNPISGGIAIPPKTRVQDNGVLKYCDPVSLVYETAKPAGEICDNDYECISNACLDEKCTSLKASLGILDQMFCWIKGFFDHPLDQNGRNADRNNCICGLYSLDVCGELSTCKVQDNTCVSA